MRSYKLKVLATMSENPLMLPAPADAAQNLRVDGPSVKLDELGPMIVNSDGVRD